MSKNPILSKTVMYNVFTAMPVKRQHKPVGMSLTVPDKSLSVRQIIENSLRGQLPLTRTLEAAFYEDIEIPNIGKMDIVDIHNRRKQLDAERFKAQRELDEMDSNKDGIPDKVEYIDSLLDQLAQRSVELSSKPKATEKTNA